MRQPQPLPQSPSEPRGKPEGSEGTSSPGPDTRDDDELEYADEPGSPLHFPDSDDDDDLEKEEIEAFGRPVGLTEQPMIDLDDSDED